MSDAWSENFDSGNDRNDKSEGKPLNPDENDWESDPQTNNNNPRATDGVKESDAFDTEFENTPQEDGFEATDEVASKKSRNRDGQWKPSIPSNKNLSSKNNPEASIPIDSQNDSPAKNSNQISDNISGNPNKFNPNAFKKKPLEEIVSEKGNTKKPTKTNEDLPKNETNQDLEKETLQANGGNTNRTQKTNNEYVSNKDGGNSSRGNGTHRSVNKISTQKSQSKVGTHRSNGDTHRSLPKAVFQEDLNLEHGVPQYTDGDFAEPRRTRQVNETSRDNLDTSNLNIEESGMQAGGDGDEVCDDNIYQERDRQVTRKSQAAKKSQKDHRTENNLDGGDSIKQVKNQIISPADFTSMDQDGNPNAKYQQMNSGNFPPGEEHRMKNVKLRNELLDISQSAEILLMREKEKREKMKQTMLGEVENQQISDLTKEVWGQKRTISE
jgi:hypothetical protein